MESCSLRDYEGNYDRFLEKNEGEAEVMAEKEAKKRELEKSQIKAKSKVRCPCMAFLLCAAVYTRAGPAITGVNCCCHTVFAVVVVQYVCSYRID